MRPLARYLPLACIACAVSSCGHASPRRTGASEAPASRAGIVAGGSESGGIAGFGRPAEAGEVAAIAGAVTRYSQALAADDGAGACAELLPSLRSQLAMTSRSQPCPQALGSLYAHESPRRRAALRSLTVTAIRVAGARAFAIYSESGAPSSFYPMQREGGRWLLAAVGGSALPR